jgi:bacteriocin biosynthesis cyclodehydratase domain-containing protein
LVSATRNAPAALFLAMNRIALSAGTPWLRANESATDLEIGPYVWPHQSACFTCLVMRRASTHEHAVEEELHERHLARERPAGETAPRGELLVAACAGAALVALEVERILTAVAPPASLNAVVRFELLAGTLETHPLLRVPRCPDCSLVAAAAEPAP